MFDSLVRRPNLQSVAVHITEAAAPENLPALERQLGERMVTFAVLDTVRANGLFAVERARIDLECDKILREIDALHERIAVARGAPAGYVGIGCR